MTTPTVKDSSRLWAGRREFERQMAEWAVVRRGWSFGADQFEAELLARASQGGAA
jgi:hypothetical protein